LRKLDAIARGPSLSLLGELKPKSLGRARKVPKFLDAECQVSLAVLKKIRHAPRPVVPAVITASRSQFVIERAGILRVATLRDHTLEHGSVHGVEKVHAPPDDVVAVANRLIASL
jgi:hypothetical protein